MHTATLEQPRVAVSVPRWSSPVTKAEMRAGDGASTIQFIQSHCRITKDSVAGPRGDLLRMRDWQQLQLYRLLARRADGLRKHRVGLFGVPRKNGKSGKAAGLALSEADSGPAGGEVYCCAGDKDQARIVYETCKQMVKLDPYLSAVVKPYKNELVWPETETKLIVVSSDAKLKEGLNPTFVVFDEVHVQPNDELWDVMENAFGARQEPMMFGITTAGDPTDSLGNDSLCNRLYQHGVKVARGEIDDPTFFFAWWEPNEGDKADWTDPKVWAESNPGLGDILSYEDMEAKMKRGPESTVRTKRLNQWVTGKLAAVPAGKWDALTRPWSLPELPEERIQFGGDAEDGIELPKEWLADSVIFLDGSWANDSTGLVGCTRDAFQFVITHHEKDHETDGPDWRVPVNSVKDDCRLAMRNGARGMLLDPYRWQQTAADLIDEGFRVVEWPTNSLARIIPAWKDWYNALMDGEMSNDGHPALERHIGNIVLKLDASGARPVKSSKTSKRHIDLGICAIGAYANRNLEFEDEKPQRAKPWASVG